MLQFLLINDIAKIKDCNKKKDVTWCVDGEKLEGGTSEYKITVVSNVQIMMPSKNTHKLFTK